MSSWQRLTFLSQRWQTQKTKSLVTNHSGVLPSPFGQQSCANCSFNLWEGRFKSQALLDEKALAAAMAYVDLNPVRAAIADTPEESEYTSIKLRAAIRKESKQPKPLMPFAGNPTNEEKYGLPFKLDEYLQLVNWTGRHFDERKRGKIECSYPDILDRLNFDNKEWLYMTKNFESKFKNLVGTAYSVRRACEILCRRPPPLSQLIT